MEMWTLAGIPLYPFKYEYDGKTWECEREECQMSVEHYIGHFDYGLSYYMINFSHFLDDDTAVGVFMTDGIGAQFTGKDRATADQITINGKVHKLDQTEIEYDPEDLTLGMRANTVGEMFE